MENNFRFPENLICKENFMIIDIMQCKEQEWIMENGHKVWRNVEGRLHREGGPAYEYADGDKSWYLNGLRHREDGPAIEDANGTKEWYLNGKLHRKDGPAVEYLDGSKVWYLNDKRHRTDGPAFEGSNGTKTWCIEGKELTEAEFNNR